MCSLTPASSTAVPGSDRTRGWPCALWPRPPLLLYLVQIGPEADRVLSDPGLPSLLLWVAEESSERWGAAVIRQKYCRNNLKGAGTWKKLVGYLILLDLHIMETFMCTRITVGLYSWSFNDFFQDCRLADPDPTFRGSKFTGTTKFISLPIDSDTHEKSMVNCWGSPNNTDLVTAATLWNMYLCTYSYFYQCFRSGSGSGWIQQVKFSFKNLPFVQIVHDFHLI